MARRPRTLYELLTARLGVHRGALAAAWLIEMAMLTQELGHVPTAAEYADWSFVNERTVWRRRAAMRDAFGDDWPDVVQWLADRSGAKRTARDVVRTELPAVA